MRQFKANDEYDQKELSRLNAEPWMVKLLGMNPEYVYWGPGEDYMETKEHGWDSSKVNKGGWAGCDFKGLDELNEVVHFYFELERPSKQCPDCKGEGYNPKTAELSRNYYNHTSQSGQGWNNSITQDEVNELVKQKRLWDLTRGGKLPTAEEVNNWNRKGIGHDAINRGILIETRAKRLGFWGYCPNCEGHGEEYTAKKAHVNLVIWVLHPRKGCSRGIRVEGIKKSELPDIFEFLKEAQHRNNQRFAKLDLTTIFNKGQGLKSA